MISVTDRMQPLLSGIGVPTMARSSHSDQAGVVATRRRRSRTTSSEAARCAGTAIAQQLTSAMSATTTAAKVIGSKAETS